MSSDLKTKGALRALRSIKSAAQRAALGLDSSDDDSDAGEKPAEEADDEEG